MANDIRKTRIRAQAPNAGTENIVQYVTQDPLGDFLPKVAIFKVTGATALDQSPTEDNRDFLMGFGAAGDNFLQWSGYSYGRGQTSGEAQARRRQSIKSCMQVPHSGNGTFAGEATFFGFSQVGGQAAVTVEWNITNPAGTQFEYVIEIDLFGGADLQYDINQITIDNPSVPNPAEGRFQFTGFRPRALFGWNGGMPDLDDDSAFCTHSNGWVALPESAPSQYACTFGTYQNGNTEGTGSTGACADKWVGQLYSGTGDINYYLDNVQPIFNGFNYDLNVVRENPNSDQMFYVAFRFDELEASAGIGQSLLFPQVGSFSHGFPWTCDYLNMVISRNPLLQRGDEDFPGAGGVQYFTCVNQSLRQASFGSHSDDGVTLAGTTGTNRSWASNGIARVLEPSAAGARPWMQWEVTQFSPGQVTIDWQVTPGDAQYEYAWFVIEEAGVPVSAARQVMIV